MLKFVHNLLQKTVGHIYDITIKTNWKILETHNFLFSTLGAI